MKAGRPLDILFAAELLLPAIGGAERYTLEVLEGLAAGHRVRAVWLESDEPGDDPPRVLPAGIEGAQVERPRAAGRPYWAAKAVSRAAVGDAVARALARRRADVVLTALHAGPAAIGAARSAGVPSVLMLPSYESLCKFAFESGSRCIPASGCRECPHALSLSEPERRELVRSRRAHERALIDVTALVAPSAGMADDCEDWCGRRPEVVPPVTALHPPVCASPGGRVVVAAGRWTANKGVGLLEALAAGIAPRRVVITERDMPAHVRSRLEAIESVDVVPNRPVAALLDGAGVLLVPSQLSETFGRLAFEGLSAGVPTLASAIGGMCDYVPSAQLISPPDDVSAWLRAIRELEDPACWDAARRAGVAAARRVLGEPPIERWDAILQGVAGSVAAARAAS